MHRAHHSLWILTALAILSAGLVSQALAATGGPVSDAMFAASLLLLLISATLLARVMRYVSRTSAAQTRTAPGRPRRDKER
jgi:uncharacterized protein (DUF58 family)